MEVEATRLLTETILGTREGFPRKDKFLFLWSGLITLRSMEIMAQPYQLSLAKKGYEATYK